MKNWFPLREDLISDPVFSVFSPVEKLLYINILSEFTRPRPLGSPDYYRSDLWHAVTLGISESKVRQARRKFKAEEWIDYTPGFRTNGHARATTYKAVKWSQVPERGDGVFFAQIHRYAYECLLELVRSKGITHRDLWVYVILAFLYWKNRGAKDDSTFFVTKSALALLAGFHQVVRSVNRLYESFRFKGGAHLFLPHDLHQKIRFANWASFSDPSEDENARRVAEKRESRIVVMVQEAKALKQRRANARFKKR